MILDFLKKQNKYFVKKTFEGHVPYPTTTKKWTGNGTEAMDNGTKHTYEILVINDI